MPACPVPGAVAVNSDTTIFVPSGDQSGFCSLEKLWVTRGSFAMPEPSGWTTYSDLWSSNRMVRPSGDQRPPSSKNGRPQGVIRRTPVPSRLTTKSATFPLPWRLGSVTPKPSQVSRVPSGDQPPPQGVSRVGSGHLNWRKVPVSGSTIVAAQFSSPSLQAVKIETWLPSGDQRGPPENPAKSCCRWLPSGLAV